MLYHPNPYAIALTLKVPIATGLLVASRGVYNLSTGRVEFLGRSPDQSDVLTSTVSWRKQGFPVPVKHSIRGLYVGLWFRV